MTNLRTSLFILDGKPVYQFDKLFIKNTDIQFVVYDFEDGVVYDTTLKGTYFIRNVTRTPPQQWLNTQTIPDRIKLLEEKFLIPPHTLPGTNIFRTLLGSEGPLGWAISLGGYQAPQQTFTGPSIEQALSNAEYFLTTKE